MYDSKNSYISKGIQNISVVDIDQLSDDDVMEFINLVSPEKSKPIEVHPVHHKKNFLKKFLAENDAILMTESNRDDDLAPILDGNLYISN